MSRTFKSADFEQMLEQWVAEDSDLAVLQDEIENQAMTFRHAFETDTKRTAEEIMEDFLAQL